MGVGEIIFQEITNHGPISFSRFMQLALYCPDCGFYEKEAGTVGQRGDFYTSVSTGALFGELLAFDFAEKLSRLVPSNPSGDLCKTAEVVGQASRLSSEPCKFPGVSSNRAPHQTGGTPVPLPFAEVSSDIASGISKSANPEAQIIEAGAHDGKLARDILGWMRLHRAELFRRIEYIIIEPSARRRGWQQTTLKDFTGKVRWLEELPDPQSPTRDPQFRGVLFANELLDAFPVHRIGWDAKARRWFEWGVDAVDGKLEWTRLSSADAGDWVATLDCPAQLVEILPDGFSTEICPAATAWWTRAAASLANGWLFTLDYGLEAEDFFQPQRHSGTLRSYRNHRLEYDVLANPGEQDITAHVNFSAIRAAGESAGWRTEFTGTQGQFLTGVAAGLWKATVGAGDWDAARKRQFQTLTHPEFLGRKFRALLQSNVRPLKKCRSSGTGVPPVQ